MKCDFSFRHYEECLQRISLEGHSVELIHDIDDQLDNSHRFAEIEKKYGISAKYFIRLHGKLYNPLTLKNIKAMKDLLVQGHELGLHFEPSFYSKEEIDNAIKIELSMLGLAVAGPINLLSIHEPARFGSIDPSSVPVDVKYYCWDSEHYKSKKYISDSGGRWREDCMCKHLGRHSEMIILTHPMWWFDQYSAENY